MGLGGAAGVTVQPAMSFRQVQVTAAHGAGALRGSAMSVPMSPKSSTMFTRGVHIAVGLISTSLHASQGTLTVGGLATSAEQNDIAELNCNSATPEKISP